MDRYTNPILTTDQIDATTWHIYYRVMLDGAEYSDGLYLTHAPEPEDVQAVVNMAQGIMVEHHVAEDAYTIEGL